MENWGYYLLALATIVAGLYIIKKIASCLIKTVVFLVMLAIIAVAFYLFQL